VGGGFKDNVGTILFYNKTPLRRGPQHVGGFKHCSGAVLKNAPVVRLSSYANFCAGCDISVKHRFPEIQCPLEISWFEKCYIHQHRARNTFGHPYGVWWSSWFSGCDLCWFQI